MNPSQIKTQETDTSSIPTVSLAVIVRMAVGDCLKLRSGQLPKYHSHEMFGSLYEQAHIISGSTSMEVYFFQISGRGLILNSCPHKIDASTKPRRVEENIHAVPLTTLDKDGGTLGSLARRIRTLLPARPWKGAFLMFLLFV